MCATLENAPIQPVFLTARSTPPQRPVRLSFRYDAGEIGFSLALYRILAVSGKRRIAFVRHGAGMYLTLTDDEDGFWLNIGHNYKGNVCSIEVSNKAFVREQMKAWGKGSGDIVPVTVLTYPIESAEIGLPDWKYPIYRLQINPGA